MSNLLPEALDFLAFDLLPDFEEHAVILRWIDSYPALRTFHEWLLFFAFCACLGATPKPQGGLCLPKLVVSVWRVLACALAKFENDRVNARHCRKRKQWQSLPRGPGIRLKARKRNQQRRQAL